MTQESLETLEREYWEKVQAERLTEQLAQEEEARLQQEELEHCPSYVASPTSPNTPTTYQRPSTPFTPSSTSSTS